MDPFSRNQQALTHFITSSVPLLSGVCFSRPKCEVRHQYLRRHHCDVSEEIALSPHRERGTPCKHNIGIQRSGAILVARLCCYARAFRRRQRGKRWSDACNLLRVGSLSQSGSNSLERCGKLVSTSIASAMQRIFGIKSNTWPEIPPSEGWLTTILSIPTIWIAWMACPI